MVANCSWASLEAIIQPAFALLALDKVQHPLEADIQKILNEQHDVFTKWKELHHAWRITEHHKMLKDTSLISSVSVSHDVVAKIERFWKDYNLPNIQIRTIPHAPPLLQRVHLPSPPPSINVV